MNAGLRTIAAVLTALVGGCELEDSDYYPYFLKALDVWVNDHNTQRNVFAGRVETTYFDRKDATVRCRALAVDAARANNLKQWGYVCCTVTSSTDCATKVR